ncbi:MAG: cell division protein ZapA [Pseudomonadota bacterium]
MPNVTVSIGRKSFTVACGEGEEAYLQTAAAMLDKEASALIDQIGRLDETRMLLMAGLMLADRTAAFEERAVAAEAQLAEQTAAPPVPTPPAPVVPAGLADTLLILATKAEGLADLAEEKNIEEQA